MLNKDFYTALSTGKLAGADEFDETRADFSRWKRIYETWPQRKEAYALRVKNWSSGVRSRRSPPARISGATMSWVG